MKKQSKPQNLTQKTSQGSPKTPHFPKPSPITRHTPESTSPLLFSPLPAEKGYGNVLDELLSKGQTASDNLFQKVLNQKERLLAEQEQKIKRLETEKEL